jgi:hypothetical protein
MLEFSSSQLVREDGDLTKTETVRRSFLVIAQRDDPFPCLTVGIGLFVSHELPGARPVIVSSLMEQM